MGPKTQGWLAWMAQLMPGRLICLIKGRHDDFKKCERHRAYLHCNTCGRDTAGLSLDAALARRLEMRKYRAEKKFH